MGFITRLRLEEQYNNWYNSKVKPFRALYECFLPDRVLVKYHPSRRFKLGFSLEHAVVEKSVDLQGGFSRMAFCPHIFTDERVHR